MNILSKNYPLEVTIQNMQNALLSVDPKISFSKELHPLTNCYSINLSFDDAPTYIYTNGKGAISDASKASALGEYIERLQTNNFFTEFYLPNRKFYPDEKLFEFGGEFLNDKLHDIYNPNNELDDRDYIDYNSDHIDKIVTLPFINLSDNQTSYIPVNILHNLYASNGLASGNNPKEAQVQAISEIFERYVKTKIIKNGYSLPKFPQEIISSFDKLDSDIKELRQMGYIVEVLDASLGGVYPVCAISLIDPTTHTLFVSFGSHPILEVSLQRTISELVQGRDLKSDQNFQTPTFDMSIVSNSFNLESHFIDSNGKIGFPFLKNSADFIYTPWVYSGKDSEDEFEFLVNITKSLDLDIYLREYNYLDFYSCQVLIPSLSEVYPIDDLVYNNTNVGKNLRDMVLSFKEYDPEDILDFIESFDDNLDIAKYIGVIFKNKFTILEFKIQLHLMLENYTEAIELLSISSDINSSSLEQLCYIYQDGHKWDEYEDALYNLFGKDIILNGVEIFNGQKEFIDITFDSEYLNILFFYDRVSLKKDSYYNP